MCSFWALILCLLQTSPKFLPALCITYAGYTRTDFFFSFLFFFLFFLVFFLIFVCTNGIATKLFTYLQYAYSKDYHRSSCYAVIFNHFSFFQDRYIVGAYTLSSADEVSGKNPNLLLLFKSIKSGIFRKELYFFFLFCFFFVYLYVFFFFVFIVFP